MKKNCTYWTLLIFELTAPASSLMIWFCWNGGPHPRHGDLPRRCPQQPDNREWLSNFNHRMFVYKYFYGFFKLLCYTSRLDTSFWFQLNILLKKFYLCFNQQYHFQIQLNIMTYFGVGGLQSWHKKTTWFKPKKTSLKNQKNKVGMVFEKNIYTKAYLSHYIFL